MDRRFRYSDSPPDAAEVNHYSGDYRTLLGRQNLPILAQPNAGSQPQPDARAYGFSASRGGYSPTVQVNDDEGCRVGACRLEPAMRGRSLAGLTAGP